MENKKEQKPKIIDEMVPGIVTGASGNDPAGIATYAISGIKFGYAQIWLLILATPMLIAVLAMSERIAMVTKKGLSANFRNHFSFKVALGAVVILIFANILTIGADIAVMAEAMTLIIPNSQLIYWVVPISFVMWYVLLFFDYRKIKNYFLWLILIFASFVFSAFISSPNWGEIWRSIISPEIIFSREYMIAALALIGTTISPYLIYWEAREAIEEKVHPHLAKMQDIIQAPGFILSNFISFTIIIATGTLLFGTTTGDLTAAQVAVALEPVAGRYASLVFAIGILGAGFLAVPILAASSALAISGLFGWREGLSLKPKKAVGFYEVITFSMLIGIQIAISGIDPIKALFYSQAAAGILMPPLILLLLILANKKSVMGKFTNGWFDNLFGSLALIVLLVAIVGLFM